MNDSIEKIADEMQEQTAQCSPHMGIYQPRVVEWATRLRALASSPGGECAEAALDAFDFACIQHSQTHGGRPRVDWSGYTRDDRLNVMRRAIAASPTPQEADRWRGDVDRHVPGYGDGWERAPVKPTPADESGAECRDCLQLIDERDHREEVIDRILDLVLGSDRAEWSSVYGYADAINDVEDRVRARLTPASGELPEDYITHHHDFRRACEIARNVADDVGDRTYWQHQMNVLDRIDAARLARGDR